MFCFFILIILKNFVVTLKNLFKKLKISNKELKRRKKIKNIHKS